MFNNDQRLSNQFSKNNIETMISFVEVSKQTDAMLWTKQVSLRKPVIGKEVWEYQR